MKKIVYMLLTVGLLASCKGVSQKYKSFDDYPVYEGNDLELTYTPQKSTFRVWSPTAEEVKLLLFDNGSDGSAYDMQDMKRSEKGTWLVEVDKDLKGKFYTFQVKINGKWMNETPGMWAKAVGVNGLRGAVIDMAETNPAGWGNDRHIITENPNDAVIYEIHMRDFSVAPNSGMKNKGKFLAFTEKGTKNSFGQSTGIDHLKELGITHVHILPSFDFASIDETKLNQNKYNWGYDPKNYNAPEGSYSTDPYDPTKRIKEFKEMVQSLHKAGIGVIMDVVYNHTFSGEDSYLNQLVPGYFYRFNPDGTWSNASGCGNETASERAMMRNYMVQSVVYWAKEYHVDGFRFDLMGVHDIETMNAIREAINKISPKMIIYGEGWTGGNSPYPEGKRAVKKNVSKLNGIAVFSDDIRDALRGNWTNNLPGFVEGRDSLENAVKFGIVGATRFAGINYKKLIHSDAPYANSPTQVINYVSCHDDMCLSDFLRSRKPVGATDADLLKFDKLAQTIVFTSQGIPFIFGGEEIFRDKKGVHNSYQSPDSINQINWDNKYTYFDLFNYYKGLITLRKSHSAFRMTSSEMLQKHLQWINFGVPNVVAFMLSDNANGDRWKRILVIFNGNRKNVSLQIPTDKWNVVCHDGKISPNVPLFTVKSSKFTVGASSASILYSDEQLEVLQK